MTLIYVYKSTHTHTHTHIYIHYQLKVFSHPQIFFSIQKVLFLMKRVKHHNGFIYHTKYKSSWATLNRN